MTLKRIVVACLGITLGISIVALLHGRPAAAKDEPAVIRASAIELVDSKGVVRAQLSAQAGGEVVFRLRDQRGRIRVKLSASEAGSGLLLLDAATERGVHALAQRAGTSLALQRGAKRRVLRP